MARTATHTYKGQAYPSVLTATHLCLRVCAAVAQKEHAHVLRS